MIEEEMPRTQLGKIRDGIIDINDILGDLKAQQKKEEIDKTLLGDNTLLELAMKEKELHTEIEHYIDFFKQLLLNTRCEVERTISHTVKLGTEVKYKDRSSTEIVMGMTLREIHISLQPTYTWLDFAKQFEIVKF